MTIVVNFPDALHSTAGHSLTVTEPVSTVGELIQALDRLRPGLARELDDPIYNIALNDEILLHGVDAHAVADGDVVEVVPSIAGG
ncbi:MAG: ThiS family [Acidobacteriota bacterium]|jgi:molybdopterin converting factor small subunit